jgi:L-amino acid N-acyltransferase YncA
MSLPVSFSHRLARFSDLAAIVSIYNSTVASREVTADTEPITTESRVSWFNEHEPSRRPLWVVEQADRQGTLQIIGWLSYSNFYGRPAYSGTAELSIYIHESMRGHGLGRYLLAQAIAFAPQVAVHTLLGFIFGHNRASLELFDRFGFERWAEMPRVATLDGIERDLIIVGKRVA